MLGNLVALTRPVVPIGPIEVVVAGVPQGRLVVPQLQSRRGDSLVRASAAKAFVLRASMMRSTLTQSCAPM